MVISSGRLGSAIYTSWQEFEDHQGPNQKIRALRHRIETPRRSNFHRLRKGFNCDS